MASIFISHASSDEATATRLATDLRQLGHTVWLDKWEIRVGDCIVSKMDDGLARCDYLVLLLSRKSTESGWVEREWKAKYWQEVTTRKTVVLPVMLEDCDRPALLISKRYADFRGNYPIGLVQLVAAIDPQVPMQTASAAGEALRNLGNDLGVLRITELLRDLGSREKPFSAIVPDVLNSLARFGACLYR